MLWRSEEVMRQQLNHLAEYADWVLPGEKEGYILTGYRQPEAIADFYLDKGVKAVIIKTGCDGPSIKSLTANRARSRRCAWRTWSTPSARATASPLG
nr:2-dehydro-3-deoxygluconokinase [Candidatus Pantoea persica]